MISFRELNFIHDPWMTIHGKLESRRDDRYPGRGLSSTESENKKILNAASI